MYWARPACRMSCGSSAHSCRSSSADGACATTAATTRSPSDTSGSPKTAACATSGLASSARSTRAAGTFSPPDLMRSLIRPAKWSAPSGPRMPRSPVSSHAAGRPGREAGPRMSTLRTSVSRVSKGCRQ
eukprot:scaffold91504_cov65-Phaeocystis_antarctica.AAC.2